MIVQLEKNALINLIEQYERFDKSSGIHMACDVPYIVATSNYCRIKQNIIKRKVVFYD